MVKLIRKTTIILIIMSMLMTMLAGCGGSSGDGGKAKILWAIHDESDTFLAVITEAMQKKAAESGVTLDVVSCQGDPQVQKEQLEKAASSGYDAIICRVADKAMTLQMEIAAGDVPIVFINNEPGKEFLKADKYVYVGSFEEDAGTFQADYIWNGLGKPKSLNVIILKGEQGHAAVAGRTNAVKRYFRDNGVNANYVFCDFAAWSDTEAYNRLDVFKKTGQDFDCIIANNDPMAVGAIQWMKDNGFDTHKKLVAGIDCTAAGAQAVEDGDLYMTVLQDTAGQGTAAIEGAMALASGKSISTVEGSTDDKCYIWVPFVPVDKSNVAQYK